MRSIPVAATLLVAAMSPTLTVAQAPACGNAGLTLPAGFCATVFADGLGRPRHVTVAPNGDVIVNVMPTRAGAESGAGSGPGGGVYLLRDRNADGVADTTVRIADAAGTGIGLGNGSIYATSGNAIVRYRYAAGSLASLSAPDTIVQDLPTNGHNAHNFVVDGATLYVNEGSRTNACQEKDRQKESKGVDPCPELETRAGIFAFDATKSHQTIKDARRFATGMRNSVALTRNPADGALYAVLHGRDQLFDNWPSMFTAEKSAENPGEIFVKVTRGADFGWPYCYWDTDQKKTVLAPEYGGDGSKADRCAQKTQPLFGYPGHWAPNGLAFYSGTQFPAQYRNGAFIAFHGSWNRAPLPQAGFRVVFQPMKNGKPNGAYTTFADGFMPPADQQAAAGVRRHRPTGLAVSSQGALFVTDDMGGTVYKVWYGKK